MNNNQAQSTPAPSTEQLERIVTTSPTASLGDNLKPLEITEKTPLEDIVKHYDSIASEFNQVGENLAADINARQEMLMGNAYSKNDGSTIGAYNYQRYYSQPLASGANQFSIMGRNKALNEGMDRAAKAAEARVKRAQDRANRYQQAQAAAAAQAQRAAANTAATRNVHMAQVDIDKLKAKGLSIEDITKMSPAQRAKELGHAVDQASGLDAAYNKGWENKADPNSAWHRTVKQLYQEFGATGAMTDDEFSGPEGQSAENKAFWKRKDVSERFGQIYSSMTGFGNNYYEKRATYVNQVNTKIQNVLDNGGELDSIMSELKNIKMDFNRSVVNGSSLAQEFLNGSFGAKMKEVLEIPNNINGTGELAKIKTELQTVQTIMKDSIEKGGDTTKYIDEQLKAKLGSDVSIENIASRVSSNLIKLGTENLNHARVAYETGRMRKDDPLWKRYSEGFSDKALNEATAKIKNLGTHSTVSRSIDALHISENLLGLDAEEMIALHKWKKDNPGELDEVMNQITMASLMTPIVSNGEIRGADGNKVPAGEVVFYVAPGMENMAATKDLESHLKNNIMIDANGEWHWKNRESAERAYNKYVKMAVVMDSYRRRYGDDANGDVLNAIQYSLGNRAGQGSYDGFDGFSEAGEKTKTGELTIKGKKIKDIVNHWNKINQAQRGDIVLGLNELHKGGTDKYNFHGIVDGELSKEDAIALATLISMGDKGSKIYDGDGFMDAMGNDIFHHFNQGVGESFVSSLEGTVNFIGGVGKVLLGGGLGMFAKPFGGYEAADNLANEGMTDIWEGKKSKTRSATFAQGIHNREEDREAAKHSKFFGTTSYEHEAQAGFRGTGHILGGIGEFVAEALLTAGAGALIKGGGKVIAKAGTSLASRLVSSSADDVAKLATKADDVVRVVSGADDVAKMASKADDVAKVANKADDVAKAADEITEEMAKNLDDSVRQAKKDSVNGLDANSSIDDITEELQKNTPNASDATRAINEDIATHGKMMALGGKKELAANIGKDSSFVIRAAAKHLGDDVAVSLYNAIGEQSARVGRNLTSKETLKVLAQMPDLGDGAKTVKFLSKLREEGLETIKGMGHSIRSNGEGLQQIAPWDDQGNIRLDKPINFLLTDGLADLAMGVGLGKLGDIGKNLYYSGRGMNLQSRYNNAMNKVNIFAEGSAARIKAEEKAIKLGRKLSNVQLNALSEYNLNGNSAKYQDLQAQAMMHADNLMKQAAEPWYNKMKNSAGYDPNKPISTHDLLKAVEGTLGIKESSFQFRAASRIASQFRFRQLTEEMPTLARMEPHVWASSVIELHDKMDLFKADGKSKIDYRQSNKMFGDILESKGFPKAEVENFVNKLNDADARAYGELGAGKMRTTYFSVAALSPADADIDVSLKGNRLAGSIGVPEFKKARNVSDQRVAYQAILDHYNSGKGRAGEIKLGEGLVMNGFDDRMLNPIAHLSYIDNQWDSSITSSKMREAQFATGKIVGGYDSKIDKALNATKLDDKINKLRKTLDKIGEGFTTSDIKNIIKARDNLAAYIKRIDINPEVKHHMLNNMGSMLAAGDSSPALFGALIKATGSLENAFDLHQKMSGRFKSIEDLFNDHKEQVIKFLAIDSKNFLDTDGKLYKELEPAIDEFAAHSWIRTAGEAFPGIAKHLETFNSPKYDINNLKVNVADGFDTKWAGHTFMKLGTLPFIKNSPDGVEFINRTSYPKKTSQGMFEAMDEFVEILKANYKAEKNSAGLKALNEIGTPPDWNKDYAPSINQERGRLYHKIKDGKATAKDTARYADLGSQGKVGSYKVLIDKYNKARSEYISRVNKFIDSAENSAELRTMFGDMIFNRIMAESRISKKSVSEVKSHIQDLFNYYAKPDKNLNAKITAFDGYASMAKSSQSTRSVKLPDNSKYYTDGAIRATAMNPTSKKVNHFINEGPLRDNFKKIVETFTSAYENPHGDRYHDGDKAKVFEIQYEDLVNLLKNPKGKKGDIDNIGLDPFGDGEAWIHKDVMFALFGKRAAPNGYIGRSAEFRTIPKTGVPVSAERKVSTTRLNKGHKNTWADIVASAASRGEEGLNQIDAIQSLNITNSHKLAGSKVSKFINEDFLAKAGLDEAQIKELKNIPIESSNDLGISNGKYVRSQRKILIKEGLDKATAIETFKHELSHAIDDLKGLLPDDYGRSFYDSMNTEGLAHVLSPNSRISKSFDLAFGGNLNPEKNIFDFAANKAKDMNEVLEKIKSLEDMDAQFKPDEVRQFGARTEIDINSIDSEFDSKYYDLESLLKTNKNKFREDVDIEAVYGMYRSEFNSGLKDRSTQKLYIDKELGDMIIENLSMKPGSIESKFATGFDKVSTAVNAIQQAQLAAGYSIYNAYSGLQMRDVIMATIFRRPIESLKMLSTYVHARNVESARQFLTDPQRVSLIYKVMALTGDSSMLDAITGLQKYKPGDDSVIDRIAQGGRDHFKSSRANGDGIIKSSGSAAADIWNTVFEEPTFGRFIPILKMKHLEFEVNSQMKKFMKKNGGVKPTEADFNKIVKDAYSTTEMFWNPHLSADSDFGSLADKAKFEKIHGKEPGKLDNFWKIADNFMFARTHQATMMGRVLNGIYSTINPKRWGDARYDAARSYTASLVGLAALAAAWNHIINPHNDEDSNATGLDPNDLIGNIINLGSFFSFNNEAKSAKFDAMYSTFTLPNRLMRTGLAIRNQFLNVEDRDPRLHHPMHELMSMAHSPWATIYDLAAGTKQGYSVWGPNSYAIDPDTGERIGYDPGKDAIAIMSYALGIADKNPKGEDISDGGILKHAYIDAAKDMAQHNDPFMAFAKAFEIPYKRVNLLGQAKAELNGNVHDSIRSFYQEYKRNTENMPAEAKDVEYQKFAKKAVERLAIWNKRHKVLENNPQVLKQAQRIIMGYLTDEVSQHDKQIMHGYWAAKIDSLGGFGQLPNESDEDYKKRKEVVMLAWNRQLEKEDKARKTLRDLGFDTIGFDSRELEVKHKEKISHISKQLKEHLNGKVNGSEDLVSLHKEYKDAIDARKNAKDWNGAKALEKEYVAKFDAAVGPYIEKYGKYTFAQNIDLIKPITDLVIIPTGQLDGLNKEHRSRDWLLSRYHIGNRDGGELITDDKYNTAYSKIFEDMRNGATASAKYRADDIINGIRDGRYTPSKKQYEQLMKIYNNINRR